MTSGTETFAFVALIVGACVLLALLIAGLILLILIGLSRAGGFRKLLLTHTAPAPAAGHVMQWQTVKVGAVTYKRMVTVALAEAGFSLTIRRKTVFIPWQDVKALGRAFLYWQSAPVLTIGSPPITTVTFIGPLGQWMSTRLAGSKAVAPART